MPISSPPRVLAINWSGARSGAARKIWLAEVVDGRMVRLESGLDRHQAVEHLIEEVAADSRMAVGLDFAFSLPAGSCQALGATDGPAAWRAASDQGRRWPDDCAEPFWRQPGRRKPELEDHSRVTETGATTRAGKQPKSGFQIGGALSTGSIREMPHLLRQQEAGFHVFLFDAPELLLVLEIYPPTLTGPVMKTDRVHSLEYQRESFPEITAAQLADAASGATPSTRRCRWW